MTLSPGSRVGPYEIIAQLGAGGMGEVYRAGDRRLGREVALKVIRRALVNDDDALDRLLREATLASSLNHPNIVTIYETGVVGADRYVAMELVEGSTLRVLSAQELPLGRVLGIARQIAEALAVAHAAQIVHRDIKPDNVMVRPDGYVKLLDFGLARLQRDAVPVGATVRVRRSPSEDARVAQARHVIVSLHTSSAAILAGCTRTRPMSGFPSTN